MKNKLIITGLVLLAIISVSISCSDQFEEPETPAGATVFDVADSNQELDIFTAAIVKTNLAKSLDNLNSGEYTVFAPHDSAFIAYFKTLAITNVASFQEADVINYIRNEMTTTSILTIAVLASRLNYHIISSKIASSTISSGNTFTTLNGARLSASHTGAYYYLNANTNGNGSKILTPDLSASNGNIHIVKPA
jgi:uncharacterized surface protein with fasciclin (FAS1) repeats